MSPSETCSGVRSGCMGCTQGVPAYEGGWHSLGTWGGSEFRAQRGLCISAWGHSLAVSPRVLRRRSQRHHCLCRLLPPGQQLPRLPLHHGAPLPVSAPPSLPPAAPSRLLTVPRVPASGLDQAARTTLGGGSVWHQGEPWLPADLGLSSLLSIGAVISVVTIIYEHFLCGSHEAKCFVDDNAFHPHHNERHPPLSFYRCRA